MSSRLLVAALVSAGCLLSTVATAAAAPAPFGHPCAPERGVRFCPAAELTDRVPSFDGTPLDVDVTLPATGDGPFPTLVMEHGYPGTKASFQAPDANGTSGATYHYNDVFYAQQGYAVVTLSARGFGRSCGVPASRTAGCERGWTHIADHRFENRDTQTLLGRLVDEGVARADALAVTGISGGGGRSVGLAFLRDRVRLPNGSLVPWRSPAGTPLRIAAAFPRWGWADLTNALIPNGRLVADAWPSGAQARSPVGVPKENWIDLLYLGGAGSGYLAPPGADPQADLTAWRARIDRGEPFGADVRAITDTLSTYIGGGAGLPADSVAPLLLEQGWTDDLFGADEATRIYARLRAASRTARVGLLLGDLGHARAGNSTRVDQDFNDRGAAFLARYLKGGPETATTRPGAVRAYVAACPKGATGRALDGRSWPALQRGAVSWQGGRGTQRVTSAGGNRALAKELGTTDDPCLRVRARRAPGTAVYETGTGRRGFTLLGAPEVRARTSVSGRSPYVAARLWDVANGRQRLVARGVLRVNVRGDDVRVRFQLHPAGYRFARGHRVRLELLGRDAPYLQASDRRFSLRLRDVRVRLPTAER